MVSASGESGLPGPEVRVPRALIRVPRAPRARDPSPKGAPRSRGAPRSSIDGHRPVATTASTVVPFNAGMRPIQVRGCPHCVHHRIVYTLYASSMQTTPHVYNVRTVYITALYAHCMHHQCRQHRTYIMSALCTSLHCIHIVYIINADNTARIQCLHCVHHCTVYTLHTSSMHVYNVCIVYITVCQRRFRNIHMSRKRLRHTGETAPCR